MVREALAPEVGSNEVHLLHSIYWSTFLEKVYF